MRVAGQGSVELCYSGSMMPSPSRRIRCWLRTCREPKLPASLPRRARPWPRCANDYRHRCLCRQRDSRHSLSGHGVHCRVSVAQSSKAVCRWPTMRSCGSATRPLRPGGRFTPRVWSIAISSRPISGSNRARIASDHGISDWTSRGPCHATLHGAVSGTPQFMARSKPARAPSTTAVTFFSWQRSLCHVHGGGRHSRARTNMAGLRHVCEDQRNRSGTDPRLHAWARGVIGRLLCKDPGSRLIRRPPELQTSFARPMAALSFRSRQRMGVEAQQWFGRLADADKVQRDFSPPLT